MKKAKNPMMKMPPLISLAIVFFIVLSVQEINAQPFNDACNSAFTLIPNDPMTPGTTVDAEWSPFCNSWWESGIGVGAWYSVAGTGNVMSVTTCFEETDFPTYLHVQPMCDTDDMGWECIWSDPNYLTNITPCLLPNGATLTWGTEKDKPYYIRVSGADTWGNFGVAAYEFTAPKNSQCANATQIQTLGTVLSGTTVNTTWSLHCTSDLFTNVYDRIAWYSVAGTGNEMTASTCHPETDYESQLSMPNWCDDVDAGCDETVSYKPCTDNANGILMTWSSVKDQLYLIGVGGVDFMVGNFGLSVVDETQDPTPETMCVGTSRVGSTDKKKNKKSTTEPEEKSK